MSDIFNNIFSDNNDNYIDEFDYSSESLDDINDTSFTKNFVKSTSSYESYEQMINFDVQEKCEKIFGIIQAFFEKDLKKSNQNFNNLIDRDNFEVWVNKYLSELLRHFMQMDFKNAEKCENLFSYIFIEFCEYIDSDYNKVFSVLHQKFQNMLKRDTIKMVKLENFKKVEKKIRQNSENTINNHKDVYFKPLV